MSVLERETPILVAEAGFPRLSELKALLEGFHLHNLTTTGRGYRAIEIARRVDFKLIIVSNSLVNMFGIDVIEAIRQKGKNIDTPIFFLIEPHEKLLREKAFSLGVTLVLEKPLGEKELREALEVKMNKQVISKSDEKTRVKAAMGSLHEAVAFAKDLRGKEEYSVAETEFCNGLTEVFCGLAEVYLSQGDLDSAAYVI
ncbi:MAG: response regulator [bacterium]|nr:response regulator [bacterium]